MVLHVLSKIQVERHVYVLVYKISHLENFFMRNEVPRDRVRYLSEEFEQKWSDIIEP